MKVPEDMHGPECPRASSANATSQKWAEAQSMFMASGMHSLDHVFLANHWRFG